jgi:hypothetical protein
LTRVDNWKMENRYHILLGDVIGAKMVGSRDGELSGRIGPGKWNGKCIKRLINKIKRECKEALPPVLASHHVAKVILCDIATLCSPGS